MLVGGKRVEFFLLLAGEVPAGVEPVRIARGQNKLAGPVGFGKFDGAFGAAGGLGRRSRAEGITLAGAAGRWSGGFVALEQNRGNRGGFFIRGGFSCAPGGGSFGFGGFGISGGGGFGGGFAGGDGF